MDTPARGDGRATVGGPGRGWGQVGAASGLLFAVLAVVGLLQGAPPGRDDPDPVISAFYADAANRGRVVVALYLPSLAGAFFLGFLGHLCRRLRRAEGEAGSLAVVALAGGVGFVTLFLAGSSASAAAAASMTFGNVPQPSAELARILPQLGALLLLLPGLFAAIVLVVATSLLALRTGVLPRWLAWAGFVAAVILLAGPLFLPLLVLPLWVAVVSVVLLQRAGAAPPAEGSVPSG